MVDHGNVVGMMSNDLKELFEVCKPVVEYMRKNYCPHDTLLITQSHAEIVSGQKCVQFPMGEDDKRL